MWPWVEPPTKAVIFAPDRGVSKLLSLISISSKHTTAASLWPPTYAAILNVTNTIFLVDRLPTHFDIELEYEHGGESPTRI